MEDSQATWNGPILGIPIAVLRNRTFHHSTFLHRRTHHRKVGPDRRFIAYTLFRESCRTVDGKLVKDLNHLNRDLSKVIVVDTNPDSFHLHPEKRSLISPWKGDKADRELIGLLPFFEAIGIYNIDDVRTTLKAYSGYHIPTEHAKRAASIREKELAENKARVERMGKFGSVFGGVSRSANAGLPADKTIYDLERERYLQAYLEDQKYWKENGEALRKQAKEEQGEADQGDEAQHLGFLYRWNEGRCCSPC